MSPPEDDPRAARAQEQDTPERGYHMSAESFRRHGYALIDWLARYQEEVEDYPVLSQVEPGELRQRLPPHPPKTGEPFEALLQDFEEIVLPGITHWQSPNFFAYFPTNTSGPAILGELLTAGLSVQGMLWATSPSCTELETHTMDWLVELLGLPETFLSTNTGGGVIQDTASSSSLCALLAARERATAMATNRQGCRGKLVAYASTQTHSWIEKAVRIAGIGEEQLRLIEVDAELAMKPQALAQQVAADRQAGLEPFFVCATVGTTSSNALDPLEEIGSICRQENLWLHVDAAMAGTAALCPEFRFIHQGMEYADSYCFNPHKWMFCGFDCDAFWVADRKDLIQALSVLPEYLKNKASESGAVIDYRDWQIPLGRRFRALKLWFVLRHYGQEGLRHHVRQHVAMAQEFKTWVESDEDFELAAPVPLNLVCFRHGAGDDFNRRLLEDLNAQGTIYLTHTQLQGQFTLRMSISQTHCEPRHVQRAWQLIRQTAHRLSAT